MMTNINISSESTSILARFIKKHPFRGRAKLLSTLAYLNLAGNNILKINKNLIPLDLKYAGDIGAFLNEGLPHEIGLLKILKYLLKEDDVFYDIGANIGYYTGIISSLGIPVISFEPNEMLLNRFEYLLKENKHISLFPIGLSDHNEELVFNALKNNHGLANFRPSKQNKYVKTLRVAPLQEVIQTYSLPEPTIIKIDVEGFEFKVLQGYGGKQIQEHKPIIFMEFADDFAKECGFNFTKLKDFCDNIGYKILRIENEGFLRSRNIEKPESGNDLLLFHKESERIALINNLINDK